MDFFEKEPFYLSKIFSRQGAKTAKEAGNGHKDRRETTELFPFLFLATSVAICPPASLRFASSRETLSKQTFCTPQ
jgi:hypothetical protein